jgi:hypothetical protein
VYLFVEQTFAQWTCGPRDRRTGIGRAVGHCEGNWRRKTGLTRLGGCLMSACACGGARRIQMQHLLSQPNFLSAKRRQAPRHHSSLTSRPRRSTAKKNGRSRAGKNQISIERAIRTNLVAATQTPSNRNPPTATGSQPKSCRTRCTVPPSSAHYRPS